MSQDSENLKEIDIVREIRKMDSRLKTLEKAVTKTTAGTGVKKYIRRKKIESQSSQHSKKKKEEENLNDQLHQLKEENKALKENLNRLMSTRRSVGGETQLSRLENDVHDLRKKYDEYRHQIRVMKQKITKKEKDLHFLRTQYRSDTQTYRDFGRARPKTAPTRPSTSHGRMSGRRSPNFSKNRFGSARSVASSTMSFRDAGMFSTSSSRSGGYVIEQKRKQITRLEKKLDRYIIKYNESQQVKERNNKILKSLQRERNGYDNQIRSIEKSLSNKKSDYRKLIQTFRHATYLKEQSKSRLKDAENELYDIKKQKGKEFEEKRKDVKNRVRLTKKLFTREVIRKQSKSGLLSDQESSKIMEPLQRLGDLAGESNIRRGQESLFSLEKTWRKIKEVTGRSTPKSVVEKFYSSQDTLKNLQNITRQSQKNIEKLKMRKNALKEKLETLRYSQTTTGIGTKRMMDEFVQQLNESKMILSKNKKEYERLRNIIIQVKSGLQHLFSKLFEVFDGSGGNVHEVMKESEDNLTEMEYVNNLISRIEAFLTEKIKVEALINEMEEKDREKLREGERTTIYMRKGAGVGIFEEEEYKDLEKLYSTSGDNIRLKSLKREETLEKRLMKKRITGILQRFADSSKQQAQSKKEREKLGLGDSDEEDEDMLGVGRLKKEDESGLFDTPITPMTGTVDDEDEEEEGEELYDDESHMVDILDRETVKKLSDTWYQKQKKRKSKKKAAKKGRSFASSFAQLY